MAYSNILVGAGTRPAQPVVRKVSLADLRDALAKGAGDFYAMPIYAMFLCIIYPIVGFAIGASRVRLLDPAAALSIGERLRTGWSGRPPLVYELSRRREAGLDTSATRAFNVFESSSIGAIAALGILLLIIFVIWVAVANAIYVANFGYASPSSIEAFLHDVFTTRPGWNLISRRKCGRAAFRYPGANNKRGLVSVTARSRCWRGGSPADLDSCRCP